MSNSRQLAFVALQNIYRRGAYTDIALDRVLRKTDLNNADRALVTELVYGIVRRQRSLDALIDRLGKKKASQQPPDLRIVLHIGLYQLRYFDRIPASAAVDTSVELAKNNGFKTLAGVVNGLLRQYERFSAQGNDPLELPNDPIQRLGILYSFPDSIIKLWLEQFGQAQTEKLCEWFNRPPAIDLRVNSLKTTLDEVEAAFNKANIPVERVPHLPQALRLTQGGRAIQQLPGFKEGWWTVQDSSAQLTGHLLAPQSGETVIDACAAPGGKTTHIAELMGDNGKIWGCDRDASRLRKLQENIDRLQLKSIQLRTGDSRHFYDFKQIGDRVLLDAPCSGFGTLHKRPDIRWQQTLEKIGQLSHLQEELLTQTASWVKPGGILVYATCTLNPLENEKVVQAFLDRHSDWHIQAPESDSPAAFFECDPGWIRVLPNIHQMDGFFMVKLKKK
ncbi:MAG: 16S rRNA (cytosine(967)-C(5))-methyltransferase [Hydrococcus sp. Prado102]|jgi:16S rRNA (cytosine967-C5)-methyltransferase|nr:16S rRNA (cytosine(967)-C(5))-methyltransferase [Hydrococcus sp. Prado102]